MHIPQKSALLRAAPEIRQTNETHSAIFLERRDYIKAVTLCLFPPRALSLLPRSTGLTAVPLAMGTLPPRRLVPKIGSSVAVPVVVPSTAFGGVPPAAWLALRAHTLTR